MIGTIRSTMALCLLLMVSGCSVLKKNIPAKEISYDFTNPKIDNTQYAEPGQLLLLKLKNINPNLYTVSVNDSIVVYEKQKPESFDNLFTKMPDLTPVSPKADTGKAEPVRDTASQGIMAQDGNELMLRNKIINPLDREVLRYTLSDFEKVKSSLSASLALGNLPGELNRLATNCYLTLDERTGKANSFLTEKINGLKASGLPAGIATNVDQQVNHTLEDIDRQISKGELLLYKLKSLKAMIDTNLKKAQYIALAANYDQKTEEVRATLENLRKMKEKAEKFEAQKPGELIAEAYRSVTQSNTDTVIQKYIPRGPADEFLFKVSITKKSDKSTCRVEPSSFTLPVYVEKGIKIDFSTGTVFNFGAKNFFDQKYRFDSVYRPDGSISDSVKIVRRNNNNFSQVSIGAFGHVYTRVRRDLNLGGMFGVSVSADQRIYYHAGFSALIGRNDRFIISSGVSIAKAKYLDAQYDRDQIMKRSLAPTTIPVEDVTRAGFFISLSYNLNLIK